MFCQVKQYQFYSSKTKNYQVIILLILRNFETLLAQKSYLIFLYKKSPKFQSNVIL